VTQHALIRQQWWRITRKDGGKTQSKRDIYNLTYGLEARVIEEK
jgi:hypothetical protein